MANKISSRRVSAILVLVCIYGAKAGGVTYTTMNTTNACIAQTTKSYIPNKTSPTFVGIIKALTGMPACTTTPSANNATCGETLPTALFATAIGPQITMSPSCVWNCGGCLGGTIAISGADGLPVELLEFSIDDGERDSEK